MTTATMTAPAVETLKIIRAYALQSCELVKIEGKGFFELYYDKQDKHTKPTLVEKQVSIYNDETNSYDKETQRFMVYLYKLEENKGILSCVEPNNVMELATGKVVKTYEQRTQFGNSIGDISIYWLNFVDGKFDSLWISSCWNSDRYDWDTMLDNLKHKYSQV